MAAEAQRAADAVGTFELVPSLVPSVIFLDIAMPGMDGYEVARRLRRMPEGEPVLLVAITGFGREEDRRRAEEAGFDRHITWDPKSLLSLLSRPVDCRRSVSTIIARRQRSG